MSQSPNEPRKKKVIRRSDWIILILVIALIAFIVGQQGNGCKPYTVEEKLEWTR